MSLALTLKSTGLMAHHKNGTPCTSPKLYRKLLKKKTYRVLSGLTLKSLMPVLKLTSTKVIFPSGTKSSKA